MEEAEVFRADTSGRQHRAVLVQATKAPRRQTTHSPPDARREAGPKAETKGRKSMQYVYESHLQPWSGKGDDYEERRRRDAYARPRLNGSAEAQYRRHGYCTERGGARLPTCFNMVENAARAGQARGCWREIHEDLRRQECSVPVEAGESRRTSKGPHRLQQRSNWAKTRPAESSNQTEPLPNSCSTCRPK